MINIEDFKKLEIKVGKVISAEKVPEADKLLKLIFDLGDEKRQIRIPLHHVNLFAIQLIDNALNARSSHPNAGTHRIDTFLQSRHSYFGAVTGLTSNRFNLNGAVIYFRYFYFQQAA